MAYQLVNVAASKEGYAFAMLSPASTGSSLSSVAADLIAVDTRSGELVAVARNATTIVGGWGGISVSEDSATLYATFYTPDCRIVVDGFRFTPPSPAAGVPAFFSRVMRKIL